MSNCRWRCQSCLREFVCRGDHDWPWPLSPPPLAQEVSASLSFAASAMVDNGVILAGAIPAALIALAADLLLSGVEPAKSDTEADDETTYVPFRTGPDRLQRLPPP